MVSLRCNLYHVIHLTSARRPSNIYSFHTTSKQRTYMPSFSKRQTTGQQHSNGKLLGCLKNTTVDIYPLPFPNKPRPLKRATLFPSSQNLKKFLRRQRLRFASNRSRWRLGMPGQTSPEPVGKFQQKTLSITPSFPRSAGIFRPQQHRLCMLSALPFWNMFMLNNSKINSLLGLFLGTNR